jgi:hypothetical protein
VSMCVGAGEDKQQQQQQLSSSSSSSSSSSEGHCGAASCRHHAWMRQARLVIALYSGSWSHMWVMESLSDTLKELGGDMRPPPTHAIRTRACVTSRCTSTA